MSASLVKMGRTYDYECGRTTHRLKLAAQILRSMGITPTFREHSETCDSHHSHDWKFSVLISRPCQCGATDANDRGCTWPEWVTDETFALVWKLADEVQTTRGRYERNRAYEGRNK